MAFAYRSGVSRSPSLSGSSPTHSKMVFTALESFCTRSSVCSEVDSNRALVPGPRGKEKALRIYYPVRRGRLAKSRTWPTKPIKVNRRVHSIWTVRPTDGRRWGQGAAFISMAVRWIAQRRPWQRFIVGQPKTQNYCEKHGKATYIAGAALPSAWSGVVSLPVVGAAFSEETNSMGFREVNDERMEELRLSRSLASLVLVDMCGREPPFKRYEGIAVLGFGPGGGEPPITSE